MNIINKYIEEYEQEHLIVKEQINGIDVVLSEDDKKALFIIWANSAYDNYVKDLRNKRNVLLAESDWTRMDDVSVDKAAWAEYRQVLRDLPENTEDPRYPVWPIRPE